LSELLSLASEIGILNFASAEFALELMTTQKVNQHEIEKVSSIVSKLKQQELKNEHDSQQQKQQKEILKNSSSSSSLISNWSELLTSSSENCASCCKHCKTNF
jgi:hypothetical protein